MKASRIRLASRLVARIGSDPVPHRIIADILDNSLFALRVRYLAAAVVLVELDQRSLPNRLLEYLYVVLRLPGRDRVTIGPGQLRLSNISCSVQYCTCENGLDSLVSLRHTLGRQHQSLALLSQISARLATLGSAREAVNAHNKGSDAVDLSMMTVYSEVVLGLASQYEHLTTRKLGNCRRRAGDTNTGKPFTGCAPPQMDLVL